MTTDESVNREQRAYWNELGGPKWVAMQVPLDAQLQPLGVAVMDALQLRAGMCVLDVGCGAGATSMALAQRVAPGEVVGLDISAPLLEHARTRAAGVDNVRFQQQADAQTFAFAAPAFDAVFSRFGVMFFADPIAAFDNLRSSLRPDGRLAFICWRAMSDNPWVTVPLGAAMPHLPEPPEPPQPGAPGPFGLADGPRTRDILERAGFVDVEVAPHDSEILLAGGGGLEQAVDLALQLGPLGRALSSASPDVRARVRAAVRIALAECETERGVTLPAATWLVTARRG